ncbi:MAG: HAD family hydrolase [Clostridia bacterium]|nr:HAD family hydrolase [Clostridia bacterium]
MIKNIVFDMDGTILNTIDDLYNSVNYALGQFGYPLRSKQEVLSFVGNGVKLLIERALPKGYTKEEFDSCFTCFMEYYNKHKNDNTAPYDGIIELMDILKKKGYNMSVVSNKFDAGVKELAENLFNGYLPVAIGESEKVAPKPNPSGVWYALELMGANKEDSVYIGDSEVDFETAKNSGLEFIAVTWGFRPRKLHEDLGAKYIAEKPLDIVEILEKL